MTRLGIISLTITMAIMSLACQRRPLYAEAQGTIVKVMVDWSDFPEKPTGMTLMFFDEDNVRTQIITNNVDAIHVTLSEGHWRVYAFNQSISEFSTLSFLGLDRYDTPLVSIDRIYETKWSPSKSSDEKTVVEPEHIGVATGEFYVSGDEMTVGLKAEDVTMQLDVTVHISGVQYLKQTRAAISGLAGGYYLTKGRPCDKGVTQLLENWTVYTDESNPDRGYARLTTGITTFGLPSVSKAGEDIASRNPRSNMFFIDFYLRDGETTESHSFEIGDQFDLSMDGGKIVLGLVIGYEAPIELPWVPDNIQTNQTSGFDATVDEWETGGTIDINM